MVRALLRVVAATLPALALTIVAPGTAHAAGTYRHDDGTREAAVRVDSSDGVDEVESHFSLPAHSVYGASGAKAWVYATADACATPTWAAARILANNRVVEDFDPCAYFPVGSYGWHAFPFNPYYLTDGGSSTIYLIDMGGASASHNASYGVDTSTSGHSLAVQRDAGGTMTVTGELMVYLELTGSVASIGVTPASIDYGLQPPGTPSAPRTVTVTSRGLQPLTVSSISVVGAQAGDFAVSGSTCSGSMAPGSTCTFDVTFTPSATGPRSATVWVSGNTSTSQTVAVSGEGRSDPPASVIATPDGAVLGPLDAVTGSVTDDLGVDREYVTFTALTPLATATTTLATTTCNPARTSCTWTASSLRTPGTYRVTAYGVDVQGIAETPGPGITVTIV
jgi:hypothetical protein